MTPEVQKKNEKDGNVAALSRKQN
jgi:hypothetical protein